MTCLFVALVYDVKYFASQRHPRANFRLGEFHNHRVQRRFREVDPEAFKRPSRPAKSEPTAELRKALLLAERLESVLADLAGISREARHKASDVVAELRQRFASAKEKSA